MRFAPVLLALIALLPRAAHGGECDSPSPDWLLCEDFEKGDLGFAQWFAQSGFTQCLGCTSGNNENPNRILLTQDPAHVYDGKWALFMPAEAAAQYQGAALVYRTCAGTNQPGCTLTNHDQLYFRAMVRLDPDHQKVHHFMAIAGSRPDKYWETDGNAGCRPNGYRWAGTTLDFNTQHQLHFYTYTPDMHCDSGGYCSGSYAQGICDGCATKDMACTNGLECCWGNFYNPPNPVVLQPGQWTCLELGMKLNTPNVADGEMSFWVNGELALRKTGMYWRDVPELGLNKIFVQHYLDVGDATQSNRIAWDDIVVSTKPIGCPSLSSNPDGGTGAVDAGTGADAGTSVDGGAGSGGAPDAGAVGNTAVGSSCGCTSGGGAAGLPFLALLALLGAGGTRARARPN